MTEPRFIVSLLDNFRSPGSWAADREFEGWDGVAVSDHVFIERQTVPHVWVTAAEMALATTSVAVATSFANNLLRSPVEFAHAALTLQRVSAGRFEAGLGAGWDEHELTAMGIHFPAAARERAGRYIEAATIVRQLFDTGRSSFRGEWYSIDIEDIGPVVTAPPALVVSVGGPRTTAALTPIADVVEIKLPGIATTGKGSLYTRALREVSVADVAALVADVRSRRPDVSVGIFLSVGCGDHPVVGALRSKLEGSASAGLFGEAVEVAATLRDIAAVGIDRVTLGAVSPDTYELLAPALFATR